MATRKSHRNTQKHSLVRAAESLIEGLDNLARIDPAAVTQAEREYFSGMAKRSTRRR